MNDKRTQLEFCIDRRNRAPEDSEEYRMFHDAAHYYERAQQMDNPVIKHRDRMKAVRRYKKAIAMWKRRMKLEGASV